MIHSKVTKNLVNSIEIAEMNVDEIGTFVCAHSFICHITVHSIAYSRTHILFSIYSLPMALLSSVFGSIINVT